MAALLLLVLIGLFGGGLLVLIRGISGVKKHDPDGSYCGHCGYDVRGVNSLNCPECGSDLKEVGILKHVKTRSATWIIIGGILMFLSLMIFLALFLFASYQKASMQQAAQAKMQTQLQAQQQRALTETTETTATSAIKQFEAEKAASTTFPDGSAGEAIGGAE